MTRVLASRPTRMFDELAGVPNALRRLLEKRAALSEVVRHHAPPLLRGVVLVGRGSSEYAALYGRHILESATGRPVSVFPPSLAEPVSRARGYEGYLAIAVSSSGETDDVLAAARALSRAGAVTVGLTARPDSRLAQMVDVPVDLGAGSHTALAAGPTVFASMAALALIAQALGTPPWTGRSWTLLRAAVDDVLEDPEPALWAARRVAPPDTVACLARGVLLPVAGQASLELATRARLVADAHSSIGFRHGPLATVGPTRPVLSFAASGPAGDDTRRLMADVRARGVRTVLVDQAPGADVPLNPAVPEGLLPLVAVLRAQQIALALARRLGPEPVAGPGGAA